MSEVIESASYEVLVVDEETVDVVETAAGPPGPPGSDADATAAIEAHRVDTTDVHGIADTADLVLDDDPRLSDARPPTAHTHPQADVAGLAAALALKQDAATAATDAELAAEATARTAGDAALSTAVALKQDAATAATDTELAAEATTRASGDATNAASAAAAQATADAALPKAGGTMTGDLVLAGDPDAPLKAATRQYVLAQIAALINGAPGTLDTLKEIADQLATDESAVSALTATVAGKLAAAANLADVANAATARTNLGLGSAATHPAGDFDSAGAAAAAQAASQPLDSDLTSIAALVTTAFGRGLLTQADAAAALTAIGALGATAAAGGDLAGNYPNPTVKADVALSGNPTAPTQAQGNNSTRIASTAYVQTEAGLLVPKSLVDAKGDVLVGTADNTVARKAVGATDGMIFRVKAANSDGLEWALPAIHSVFTSGRYYTGQVSGIGSSTLGGRLAPFYLTQTQTFDRIACFVQTLGAGSAVRLGVFNDDGGGKPSTVALDAGTVASTSTGAKEITISLTLGPGLYWLGGEPQGGSTPALIINNNQGGQAPAIGYDAPAFSNVMGWSFSAGGAFTNSPTVGQTGTNYVIWLRAA